MWTYDHERGEWVQEEPTSNVSQHPLIGVALLVLVLYAAYLFSGSPTIIITGI